MKNTLLTVLLAGACVWIATNAALAAAPLRTVAHGMHSGIEKPEKTIIRTQDELQKLWTRMTSKGTGTIPKELPKVDWTQEMVVAVFLGTRPSSGYKVDIRDVKEASGKLVVKVEETKPPKDAITLTVITSPYQLAAVKKSSLPVQWE